MSLFKAFQTPASLLWRAFFIGALACGLLSSSLLAQAGKRYRPAPDYVQVSKPDQAEGRRLMEEFRSMGIPGEYYVEFQLRMMPRRGDDRVSTGRLWGGHRNGGTWARVILLSPEGAETRLLIVSGPSPALWLWKPGMEAAQRLNTAELFKPMGDSLLTPFDLQMPYLYWQDFVYEGLAKVRDRPSHRFLLYPPADISVAQPGLFGVRVSIDSQFKAMVESQQLGEGEKPLKLLSLGSLKKTRDQWIVRSIEVRDEVSRSKTQLNLTAAALGLSFSDVLATPGTLPDEVRAPDGDRLDRF